MASSPEEHVDDAVETAPPSWFGLRVGVPIAVILIGLSLASLWDLQTRVLASARVTLGRQRFHLQLKDDRGGLSGLATGSQGGVVIQHMGRLGAGAAPPPGGPFRQEPQFSRSEVRGARLQVDRQRHEARFLLERRAIVFDGRRFSIREAQ